MFSQFLLLAVLFLKGTANTSPEVNIPPKSQSHELRSASSPSQNEGRPTMKNLMSDAAQPTTIHSVRVNDILRLPKTLKPLEYVIKIIPYVNESRVFFGDVTIELKVLEVTSEIQFHMANISLIDSSLTITRGGNEVIGVIDQYYLPDSEVTILILDAKLYAGESIKLFVSYWGYIGSGSLGLNEIEIPDDHGGTRRLLATYLQPTGARHLFPCMDEPFLKARFLLRIAKRKGETVLSNMEQNITFASSEDNSLTWVEFERSPLMSTYLVAFVVFDFVKLVRNARSNKVIRVWARKSLLQNARYAAIIATKVVEWYQEFTGVDFPLRKLDLIILPSYSVPGMENFGLIISEEKSLITNGKLKRREWVATVAAHEVAHQWAGDLVTPIWWSQFWLSEGFATYLAALALDHIEPSLDATNLMVSRETMWFRRSDAGLGSKSLVVDYFDPLNENLKNSNIYYKGAALLRMLSSILGEQNFFKGIKNYFKNYQFGSASQDEFFETLIASVEEFGDVNTLPVPLCVIMSSWTSQKSYPAIHVSRHDDGVYYAKQQIVDQEEERTTKDNTILPSLPASWWVPVTYATSRDQNFSDATVKNWIPRREVSPVPLIGTSKEDEWVVVNVQQSAYLRVTYDDVTWKAIGSFLVKNHLKVHVLNRAQLVEDAFYFFERGLVKVFVPLGIISYFPSERSLYPIKAAFVYLQNIEILLRGEPAHKLLQQYILSLIYPKPHRTFGKSHQEEKLHQYLLSWRCRLQESNCVQCALQGFELWKKDNDINVFPELAVESYLCAAIEAGTFEDWTIAFKRYLNSSSDSDSRELLRKGLACTANETTVLEYLEAISEPDNGVTSEDARKIYNELTRSLRWNNFMWTYLRNNWVTISERFKSLPVPFVNTPKDLEQLKLLFKEHFSHFPEFQKNIDAFLIDSKKQAKQSAKIISEVSEFLTEKYIQPLP